MRWQSEQSEGFSVAVRYALQIIGAIGQSPNMASLASQFPNIFASSDHLAYVPATPGNSFGAVIQDLINRTIMFVGTGMSGTQNVQACLNGWTSQQLSTGGMPQPWLNAGNTYWNALPFTPDPSYTQLVFLGHSFGGATVQQMAFFGEANYQNAQIYCYTFGAPKSIIQGQQEQLSRTINRRIVLPDDPVPLLPPSIGQVDNGWIFGTASALRNMARWTHPTIAYAPGDDNLWYPYRGTTGDCSQRNALNLAAWISGVDAFGSPLHTIQQYFTAIQNAVDPERSVTDQPEVVRMPRVVVPTAVQIDTAIQGSIVQYQQQIAANPNQQANMVQASVTPVPGEKYYGTTSQGHLAVGYAGNVVAYVKTRRLRRSLVRYLNRTM